MFSTFDDVRAAAVAGLKRHALDHYAMLFLAALRSPLEAQAWVDGPAAYYTVYQEGALADLRLSYTLSVSAWELLGDGSLVTPEAAAAPITGSRVRSRPRLRGRERPQPCWPSVTRPSAS